MTAARALGWEPDFCPTPQPLKKTRCPTGWHRDPRTRPRPVPGSVPPAPGDPQDPRSPLRSPQNHTGQALGPGSKLPGPHNPCTCPAVQPSSWGRSRAAEGPADRPRHLEISDPAPPDPLEPEPGLPQTPRGLRAAPSKPGAAASSARVGHPGPRGPPGLGCRARGPASRGWEAAGTEPAAHVSAAASAPRGACTHHWRHGRSGGRKGGARTAQAQRAAARRARRAQTRSIARPRPLGRPFGAVAGALRHRLLRPAHATHARSREPGPGRGQGVVAEVRRVPRPAGGSGGGRGGRAGLGSPGSESGLGFSSL